MAELDNRMALIGQQVSLSHKKLVQRLHRALSDTLFSNRYYIRPSDIESIAVTEANAFSAFLQQPYIKRANDRGRYLCRLGLGSPAVLRLGQVLRRFCVTHLPETFRLPALNAAESYYSAVTQGFMETQETILLEEQERIRSALQRTLNNYNLQLKLAADIAGVTSSILDLAELLHTSVELIRDRLDFDYVGLFLADDYNRWAVLRAGTGETGRRLLEQGYKVKVEEQASPIGWCMVHGTPRVVLNTGKGADGPEKFLLQDVYSEVDLPLVVRGKVIGAVSIQSRRKKSFAEQDVTLLRVIVDQVAGAIQNARSFAETQTHLEELRAVQRQYLRETWANPLPQQLGYLYEQSTDSFTRLEGPWPPETDQAASENRPAPAGEAAAPARSTLVVPITLRGQVIGSIDLADAAEAKNWSKDEIDLAATVVSQTALSLENARLLQETRAALDETERLARQLAWLNEMGAALSQTASIDEILSIVNLKTNQIMSADQTSVTLFDPAGDKPAMFTFDNSAEGPPAGSPGPVEAREVDQALRQKQIVTVSDIEEVGLPQNYRLEGREIRSLVIAPLIVSDRTLGALVVGSKSVDAYSESDERLVRQIAAIVAATIENRRLFEQTQKRATELEEATSFLDSIIENIPSMLFVKDAKDLHFVRLNKAGEELIGVSRSEIIGKSDYDLFPKEEADFFTAKDREILAGGDLLDIPEEAVHTADKGVRYLHTRKVPILDAQGNPRYLVGISEDITIRKQTEDALLKRAMELETVARVGLITSTILDTDKLLQTVVELSKAGFDLHTHIYLFDEAQNSLTLAAGADPVSRQLAIEGRQIFLDHSHSLAAQAARGREPVVDNDIRKEPDFHSDNLLPGVRAEMAIPMIAGNNLLGVLDVQAEAVDRFTNEDIHIQTTLAAQVAAVLQNTYLFQQIGRALAETEILYHIGTKLNAVTDLDEVLTIIALSEVSPNLSSAALLLFETDEAGQPEYAELVAASLYDEAADSTLSLPLGSRFALADFPLAKLWLSHPEEPLLISRVADDSRLDSDLRVLCQQANIRTMAIIPLRLGQTWVGLASMIWIEPHRFKERDRRLYRSIAGQTAVVVNNWLLLRQAEERALQLEQLSRIETVLSQAVTEEDILAALALAVEDNAASLARLAYIEEEAPDRPAAIVTVASWREGEIWFEDSRLNQSFQPDRFPLARLFLTSPDQVILVEDVTADSRVDAESRETALRLGMYAVALMPLRSGGRWQGVATFSWEKPHEFSRGERFLFQQLLEPVAAVVAGRRAYLTQQTTLAETELLYNTIRRINEASDLQEVVAAVAESLAGRTINRVVLTAFEQSLSGDIAEMRVLAAWHSGEGTSPLAVGEHYPQEISRMLHSYLASPTPLVFADLEQNEDISPTAAALLGELNISALAVLPLWIGRRQLGALLLEAEDVYYFSHSEERFYTALAQQMAVTIDNQRLLAETKAALAEVEATQRRYTRQAWEAYQTRKTVTRAEQKRAAEIVLDSRLLEEEVGQAVASKQVVVTKPPGPWPESGSEAGDKARLPAKSDQSNIIVPLTVRDEVIGVLGLQETDETRVWSPEEVILVEAIAREIAQAAENLRLLDETQQRAARERRVNEISEKIQAAQTMEEALQIAVKEVGLSLQAPQTTVQLKVK